MSHDEGRSSSASLLRSAIACQPQGWSRLCACYGPLVYRWTRAAGLQDSDAQDVGQEVFSVVAHKLAQFRDECPTAPFRAWLWGITRNKLREFRRDRGRMAEPAGGSEAARQMAEVAAESPSESGDSSGSDACPVDEDRASRMLVLGNALTLLRDEIEPRTWHVFWRTTVDLVPAAEVARELGLQSATVRQARYRVLRRLRLLLADTGEFGDAS